MCPDSLSNIDFEELSQSAKSLEKKAIEPERRKEAVGKKKQSREILLTDIEGLSYADLLSHLTKTEKSIISTYYGTQVMPGGSESDFRADIARKEAVGLLIGKKSPSTEAPVIAVKAITQPPLNPKAKTGQEITKASGMPFAIPVISPYASPISAHPELPIIQNMPVMPYISTTPPMASASTSTASPVKKSTEKQSIADIARDIQIQLETVSPGSTSTSPKNNILPAIAKTMSPAISSSSSTITTPMGIIQNITARIRPPPVPQKEKYVAQNSKIEEIHSIFTKKAEEARKETVEKSEELENRIDSLKQKMESETNKQKMAELQKQIDDMSSQKKDISKNYDKKIDDMKRESEKKEAGILAQLEKLKRESQDAIQKAKQDAMMQAQQETSNKTRAETEKIRKEYEAKLLQAQDESKRKEKEIENKMNSLKARLEEDASKKNQQEMQKKLDALNLERQKLESENSKKEQALKSESSVKINQMLSEMEKLRRESQDAIQKAKQEAVAQAQQETFSKTRAETEKIRKDYEAKLQQAQEESKRKEKEIENKMSSLKAKLEEDASKKNQQEMQKKLDALNLEREKNESEKSKKEQALKSESSVKTNLMLSQMEILRRENEALQSKLKDSAKTAETAQTLSEEKLKGDINNLSNQLQSEMDMLRETYETKIKLAQAEGVKHESFQNKLNQMSSNMKTELEQARRDYHNSLLKSPKATRENSEDLLAKLRVISEKNRVLRDELTKQYATESQREEQIAQEIQRPLSASSNHSREGEDASVPQQMRQTQEILPNTSKHGGLFGRVLGSIFGNSTSSKSKETVLKPAVASPQEGNVKSPAEQKRLIIEINNMDDITITNYAKQNMRELYGNFNLGSMTPGQFRFKVREHISKERGLPPGIIASGLMRDQNPFEQISNSGKAGKKE